MEVLREKALRTEICLCSHAVSMSTVFRNTRQAEQYCTEGLLDRDVAHRILDVIAQERRATAFLNDGEETRNPDEPLTSRLNLDQMRVELSNREELMRGGPGDVTDQSRTQSLRALGIVAVSAQKCDPESTQVARVSVHHGQDLER